MSKIWIWIFGSVLIVSLILGAFTWYISRHWKDILETQLKKIVLQETDSLYIVEYDRLNINPISGVIVIKDLRLTPDSSIYKQMITKRKAPDNIYQLLVGNLVVRSFDSRLLYTGQKLHIDKITFNQVKLEITNQKQPYNTPGNSRSLFKAISNVLKEIQIGEIESKGIHLTYTNKNNRPVRMTTIENLNIKATDILLDSLSARDKSRFYNAKNINFSIDKYSIATADSLYFLTFDKIAFSSSAHSVKVREIKMVPRYTVHQFYRKVRYARDRFTVDLDKVSINRIDIPSFIKAQKLYVGSIGIDNSKIRIYNDNYSLKKDPHKKIDLFPHQQLQNVALSIRIDTVTVKNGALSYSLFDQYSNQAGKVFFERSYVKILNVTNDSAAIVRNPIMHADLTTHLMNTGKIDVNFDFNLTDKRGAFAFSGTLGAMNGRALNAVTKPLGRVNIRTATVTKMKFYVKANQRKAQGEMEFYYRNLNIQLLKIHERSGKLQKQGFASRMANMFVVHNSNPNAKGIFTPGNIYYERSSTTPFFSFIWQALFTGLKESIGVNEAKEDRILKTTSGIKSKLKKPGELIQKIKDQREDRKIKRQNRRKDN